MTVPPDKIAEIIRDAQKEGQGLVATANKNGVPASDIPTAALLDHIHAAALTGSTEPISK